jgi:hypothetical protein
MILHKIVNILVSLQKKLYRSILVEKIIFLNIYIQNNNKKISCIPSCINNFLFCYSNFIFSPFFFPHLFAALVYFNSFYSLFYIIYKKLYNFFLKGFFYRFASWMMYIKNREEEV